jgi:5-formyltetrahydrofolate cyclo-ligase
LKTNKTRLQLRRSLIERRNLFDPSLVSHGSQLVIHNLKVLITLLSPEQVCAYWPFRNEPDLRALMTDSSMESIVWGVPVIGESSENTMRFHRWSPACRMKENRFGISEPEWFDQHQIIPSDRTLICAPALTATKAGARLGYGGGYYDRFFDTHPSVIKCAIIYDEFFDIPFIVDKHDRAVEWIVTSRRIVRVADLLQIMP